MTKRYYLSLVLLIAGFACLAQIEFERGYFIDNEGGRTDCLIRNQEWKKNPDRIKYRKSANGPIKDLTIEEIQGFGVGNAIKYTRFVVDIDLSNDNMNTLTKVRTPRFVKDTLLLKSEVEGKASLYSFEGYALVRYFYSVDDSEVKQLVFKRYWNEDRELSRNNDYMHQLATDLSCPKLDVTDFERTRYSKRSLLKLFKKYHDCQGADRNTFANNLPRKPIQVSLLAGGHSSDLTVQTIFENTYVDVQNAIGYQVGVQLEYFLNFNKNKWAVTTGPVIHSLQTTNSQRFYDVTINYTSLELPIGIRHYFYISDKSRLFLNLGYARVIGEDINSTIEHSSRGTFEMKSLGNGTVGGGYNFNDRLSLEVNYGFRRRVLRQSIDADSDYQSIFLLLGVKLF